MLPGCRSTSDMPAAAFNSTQCMEGNWLHQSFPVQARHCSATPPGLQIGSCHSPSTHQNCNEFAAHRLCSVCLPHRQADEPVGQHGAEDDLEVHPHQHRSRQRGSSALGGAWLVGMCDAMQQLHQQQHSLQLVMLCGLEAGWPAVCCPVMPSLLVEARASISSRLACLPPLSYHAPRPPGVARPCSTPLSAGWPPCTMTWR